LPGGGRPSAKRLRNPTNGSQAAATGRAVQTSEADRFAANVLPAVAAIRASGINTLTGIADALNARGIRSPRGGKWHVSAVQNLIARGSIEEQLF
jgi:Recombinase